jgi:hypothetical protein
MARKHLDLWLPEYLRRLTFFTGDAFPAKVTAGSTLTIVGERNPEVKGFGASSFELLFSDAGSMCQVDFHPPTPNEKGRGRDGKISIHHSAPITEDDTFDSLPSKWAKRLKAKPLSQEELVTMAYDMVVECLSFDGSV